MAEVAIITSVRNSSRAIPAFAIVALASVAIAKFVIQAPARQLAVTALVPAVSVFLVSRLLVLLTSFSVNRDREQPPPWFRPLAAAFLIAVIAASASLISAGLYGQMHFSVAKALALRGAAISGLTAIASFLAMLASAVWQPVVILFGATFRVVLMAILDIPKGILDGLKKCLPHLNVMWHGR